MRHGCRKGAAVAFESYSVLVVDDESFTRKVLARLLSDLGFRTVREAADGVGALEEVRLHRPDVVLCDVEMKPLDGLEFLRALRAAEGPLRTIPVILMTNRADPQRTAEAGSAGADAVLQKPVTRDLLRSALTSRLR